MTTETSAGAEQEVTNATSNGSESTEEKDIAAGAAASTAEASSDGEGSAGAGEPQEADLSGLTLLPMKRRRA